MTLPTSASTYQGDNLSVVSQSAFFVLVHSIIVIPFSVSLTPIKHCNGGRQQFFPDPMVDSANHLPETPKQVLHEKRKTKHAVVKSQKYIQYYNNYVMIK